MTLQESASFEDCTKAAKAAKIAGPRACKLCNLRPFAARWIESSRRFITTRTTDTTGINLARNTSREGLFAFFRHRATFISGRNGSLRTIDKQSFAQPSTVLILGGWSCPKLLRRCQPSGVSLKMVSGPVTNEETATMIRAPARRESTSNPWQVFPAPEVDRNSMR
jgi:hypothetical protein